MKSPVLAYFLLVSCLEFTNNFLEMHSIWINFGLELVSGIFGYYSFGAVNYKILIGDFIFFVFDKGKELLTCDTLDFMWDWWLVKPLRIWNWHWWGSVVASVGATWSRLFSRKSGRHIYLCAYFLRSWRLLLKYFQFYWIWGRLMVQDCLWIGRCFHNLEI